MGKLSQEWKIATCQQNAPRLPNTWNGTGDPPSETYSKAQLLYKKL
jgi:hypothetical protein